MRDRLTTKDALVFIALSQQDLAGIYWMIWEPMMMSGLKAFQYLLDWIEHRTGQAALPHPALGQDLTPFMDRGSEPSLCLPRMQRPVRPLRSHYQADHG